MISKYNVATYIKRGNAVVLAKRVKLWEGQPVPFGGYWSPFAGAVEDGENPLTAAIREIEEESQLSFEITDLKYIKTIQREDSEMILYYIEDEKNETIKLNEEHTQVGTFLIEHVLELPTEYKVDGELFMEFKKSLEKT